jgi:pimeloyl-ACP methyl ester carboxylesterase
MISNKFSLDCDFRTISVNGKGVQTYSIGSGPKIILSFPAFPHSGLMYALFLLNYDLSKVRLITFDLPGWIGSTEQFDDKGKFDVEDLIEIIDAVIKEYNLDKFNVLGYSYGSFLAIMTASRYIDRVDKIALVSPIVRSNLAEKSIDGLKLKVVKNTRSYFLLRAHISHRFNLYKKSLIQNGIPEQFIYSYEQMMKNVKSRYLFESLYHLFFSDSSYLLKEISDKQILVASSKDETRYFRQQSGYIRHMLESEKSIYLDGGHHDFILHPQKDVVKKIVNFLIS